VAESTHSRASRAKTEETEPEVAAQSTGNGGEATGAPTSLPVQQLIENSGPLLDQPAHVVGPALAGHPADEEMTVETAKFLVQQWLDRPVEVDPATQEA
jgi:hypothetical protein